MKKKVLASLVFACLPLLALAQSVDDLYYIPKKSNAEQSTTARQQTKSVNSSSPRRTTEKVYVRDIDGNTRNVDEYNRRYSSRDNTFSSSGDTLYINEKPYDQRGEWVGGFNGSSDDYDYAMRIVRFRSPRYAIPVSSPLYWDVVYGGLYPSWDWNIYDDGMYAYVFPSYSNRLWWDWRFSWGISRPWGLGYYSWYSPWYDPWYGYSPYWYGRGYYGYYGGYYGGWGYWNSPYYYDRYYGGWGRGYRYVNDVSNRRSTRYADYSRSGRGYSIGGNSVIVPDRNSRRAGSRVVRSGSDNYNYTRSGDGYSEGYTRPTRSANTESTYSRPSSTRSGSYSGTGSFERMRNNGGSSSYGRSSGSSVGSGMSRSSGGNNGGFSRGGGMRRH